MKLYASKRGVSLLVFIWLIVSAHAFAQSLLGPPPPFYIGGIREKGDANSVINVVDVAKMAIINRIPIPRPAGGIAFNSDGSLAYVALFGTFDNLGNEVAVIDTAAQVVIAIYTGVCGAGFDQGPFALTITPDDAYVFASCLGNVSSRPGRVVARINTADGTITRVLLDTNNPVGPFGCQVSPAGDKLYVSEFGSALAPRNRVSVIENLSDEQLTVSRRITVGRAPALIKFCADASFAYEGDNATGTISRLNVQTDTVAQTITLPGSNAGPMGIAINSDCSRAYVVQYGTFVSPTNNKLTVIDVTSGRVINSIEVPPGSFDVAISPNDAYLAVSVLGNVAGGRPDNRAFVLDITDPDTPKMVGNPLIVGAAPTFVAFSPF